MRTDERPADRSRRGFTLIEIMVVIALISMLSGAVAVGIMRASEQARRKTAKTQAIALAQIAEAFLGGHAAQGCPTLEELKRDGLLSHRSKTKDPWGTDYEIRCEPAFVVVVSAGVDQAIGTDDDITSEDL